MSNGDQITPKPLPRLVERGLEILPGLITWTFLTSPIWLSLRLPTAMAYLIIFLDVYWLYRAVKTAVLSLRGYHRMQQALSVDWLERLERDFGDRYREIEHLFIIPSWKERGYIIETNLEAIAKSKYPLDKVRVILALEERDDETVKAEKRAVAEKYRDKFAKIYVTEHPDGIVGEVIGPGSNRTWALKHLIPELEKELDIDKTILTTLDADFAIHPQLIAGLTYQYLQQGEPRNRSFQGVFIYSNNYWQAPAPMRLIASSLTISQLAELVENWKYVNFSSHSMSLRTLIDLDYWTIDHVNDDSHLYWKAFYHFNGDYLVIPYWLPIYGDTVLDESLSKTLVNQYRQLQRWAYGVEHRPYIIKQSFQSRKTPLLRRVERLLFILRADLVWATIAFLTGFGALISLLVNPDFGDTVLGSNLIFYSGLILTIAIVGLIPAAYLNNRISPPVPADWSKARKLRAHLQILLAPLVQMTFGSIPAIDAQTRFMLGKYLAFRVTRKYRRTNDQ